MLDWLIWKGVDCTEYGIHVLGQPSFAKPKERTETITIPGRSGALTKLEGDDVYDNLQLSCTCLIHNSERIGDIDAYLSGASQVEFATRPGGFYNARISNQIAYSKVLRGNPHMNFTIQFDCEPFFYLSVGNVAIPYYNPTSGTAIELYNPGNIWSEPLITVWGTGDIDLVFDSGELSLTSVNTTTYGYITIDSAAKVAYTGTHGSTDQPLALVGTHVSGTWPRINQGVTKFTPTGTARRIDLTPRWRCL